MITSSRGATSSFTPECLTVFLNNACMLGCRYCHATPGPNPDPSITREALVEAARLVSASCGARGVPMTLALHGGGEPLLDPVEADRILGSVRAVAAGAGVPLRTYVATGGVLAAENARWAAGEFDLIGLSCDGPPEIQDAQRPMRTGGPTSSIVERTADIFRECGARFHVRATVTRETLDRQAEIVIYAARRLAPPEVRLEPVYANPGAMPPLHPQDAERFVHGFLEARETGAAEGVAVTTSLARPGERYGPHCNALRAVVNLVPGDIATGCFVESRPLGIERRGVRVGGPEGSSAFCLDERRLAALRLSASTRPSQCSGCVCEGRCTLGCPDVCILDVTALERHVGSFRCRTQQLLMTEFAQESDSGVGG